MTDVDRTVNKYSWHGIVYLPTYLNNELGYAKSNVHSCKLTWEHLLSRGRELLDKETEYKEETFAIINVMFSNITERVAVRILSYSKDYTEHHKRSIHGLKEYGKEIESLKIIL